MTNRTTADSAGTRIRLGISSCLLGEQVRFDGGHKHDPFLTQTLGKFVEWVPVCPEVELGLGTPRPAIRLEGPEHAYRLVEPTSGRDLTDDMRTFAGRRVADLAGCELHGYVLKSKSPSCGMERVRIAQQSGPALKKGVGVFAAALMAHYPLLPVEEEGRLQDVHIRENFIERTFAYQRWHALVASKPRAKDVVAFHARHKYTLLSHSREHYTQLGRLVAGAGKMTPQSLLDEYGRLFMDALNRRATPKKHANVMHHLMGFMKRDLDADDKAELLELIDAYRNGLVPLIVPLTLLRHHLRRHPVEWALDQTYLNPYPAELMLRNHV